MRVTFSPQLCAPKYEAKHCVKNTLKLNTNTNCDNNISFGSSRVPKFIRNVFETFSLAGSLLLSNCSPYMGGEYVSKGHISKIFDRTVDSVENIVTSRIICDSIRLKKNNKIYYQQGAKISKHPIRHGTAEYEATFVARYPSSSIDSTYYVNQFDDEIAKKASRHLRKQTRGLCGSGKTYDVIGISATENFDKSDLVFFNSEMRIERSNGEKKENLSFYDLEFFTKSKKQDKVF